MGRLGFLQPLYFWELGMSRLGQCMGCIPRSLPWMRRCCRLELHTWHPWLPSTWSSIRPAHHTRSSEFRDSALLTQESLRTC